VQDDSGRWFMARVLPYRSGEDRIEGVVITFVDITARKNSEETLRQAHLALEERIAERTAELARSNEALTEEIAERARLEESRSELQRRLASAENEERRRLSRELHDQMGQLVTALTLELRALENSAANPLQAGKLREVCELAERVAREIQHLAVELRPAALDNLGLKLAVLSHLEEWSERHGIGCDFHSVGLDEARFSRDVETAIFRVVQEGLTNVLKHAQASKVSLILESRGGGLSAILEDDGMGFNPIQDGARRETSGRLGLLGMQERLRLLGGTLQVDSTPGSGTTLFARVPFAASEDGRPNAQPNQ
jgi:two-component system, chemotaxis family, CheB/CheR fusion protein